MYEKITYEALMERMLERLRSDIDKREGSAVWDALGPAAIEMKNLYIAADGIYIETFADTASREFLIRRAAERGIYPYPATHSIVKGEFSMNVPIGSRFSLDTINFVVTERIENCIYRMQCETIGTIGNKFLGDIIPIEYIKGLKWAKITEILIPGEDEEDTESIRRRYFESINNVAFGGNIADYKQKVHAISGVGGVKVTPIWNGPGTVKLTILASDYNPPNTVFVNDMQELADPDGQHGRGMGFAPIGHWVTVVGAIPLAINIETKLTLQQDYTWEMIQPNAEEIIEEYLLELRKKWEDSKNLVVRISQIETRFLDLEGVIDIAETKINGAERNLMIESDQVPMKGELTVESSVETYAENRAKADSN